MYFGTDPEYLVVTRLGRRPVPAHKVGMPDKQEPMILKKASPYGDWPDWESRCFRDGYMVEINVRPDTCRQTATFRVQRALQVLKRKLHPQYELVPTPAVRINLERDMKGAPADVLRFGCEPSFDAYELEAKVPPIDATTHPMRYAGGHLHFGYTSWGNDDYGDNNLEWMTDKRNHPMFIKLLDLYLGLPLTYLFDSKQTFQRRRFYGQAGEYRSQKYGKYKHDVGVEYRTPGPEVWNHPWVSSFALGVGRWVGYNFKRLAKTWDKSMADDLRLAINEGVGLSAMMRRIPVTGYNEYPSTSEFEAIKPYATPELALTEAHYNTVYRGFSEWAYSKRLITYKEEE